MVLIGTKQEALCRTHTHTHPPFHYLLIFNLTLAYSPDVYYHFSRAVSGSHAPSSSKQTMGTRDNVPIHWSSSRGLWEIWDTLKTNTYVDVVCSRCDLMLVSVCSLVGCCCYCNCLIWAFLEGTDGESWTSNVCLRKYIVFQFKWMTLGRKWLL